MDEQHNRHVIEWLSSSGHVDGQCQLTHPLPISAAPVRTQILMSWGACHTEMWCYAVHNFLENRDILGDQGSSEQARRSVDINFTHAGEFSNYDECS